MEIAGLSAPLWWFLLGMAFLAAEALTPGFFLFFFGLGSWVAALFALGEGAIVPQILVFMAASLAGLVLFRKKLKSLLAARPPRGEVMDDPLIAAQYIGREAAVVREIAPGRPGLAQLNGVDWRARSEVSAFKPGDRARVKGLEGLTLILDIFEEPPAGGG